MDSSKVDSGTDAKSIERGHEPDAVPVKPIAQFAILMVVGAVFTWYLCYILLKTGVEPDSDPKKKPNPIAKERNEQPLNERFARIDQYDPKADVKAPRLEYLKIRNYQKDIAGDMEPPWLRSVPPTKEGNPPAYHPEDLRADRIPALNQSSWGDEKKGIARIPIEDMMKIAIQKKMLPTQAKPVVLDAIPSSDMPKLSNAGQGIKPPEKSEAKADPEPKKKEPGH